MTYEQSTGLLTLNTNKILGKGYSGYGPGKNNPEMESIKDTGPIPKGRYMIGKVFDDKRMGPFVISLIPDPKNKMYGRSGFFIHGDDIQHPGFGSHGCPIFGPAVRNAIIDSKEKYFDVV